MKFVETSAKSSKNVEDSFILMTKEIITQSANRVDPTPRKPAIVIDKPTIQVKDKNCC
jgi:hypothetical protein